jgi:DNA-binding protein H-NS
MANINLEKMSIKELRSLSGRIDKAIASVQVRERAELKKKMEALAQEAGFRLRDLVDGRGSKGRKVAAKYRNPQNPSETWAGRGRMPLWLSAKLKGGAKLEKFLIA